MPARVDSTRFSTVVWCTGCPDWTELASSAREGHDIATQHEHVLHPMSRNAEINRHKFLAKHAA
jgi:hypothetical protein